MSGAVDPVILARVREAQAAIRRSLSVAEELLRDEGLPLSIVAGSAVLADFDLGEFLWVGCFRRAADGERRARLNAWLARACFARASRGITTLRFRTPLCLLLRG